MHNCDGFEDEAQPPTIFISIVPSRRRRKMRATTTMTMAITMRIRMMKSGMERAPEARGTS
jgi:hypothetical protein